MSCCFGCLGVPFGDPWGTLGCLTVLSWVFSPGTIFSPKTIFCFTMVVFRNLYFVYN